MDLLSIQIDKYETALHLNNQIYSIINGRLVAPIHPSLLFTKFQNLLGSQPSLPPSFVESGIVIKKTYQKTYRTILIENR